MHEHWLNKKKRSASMSNQRIDHFYEVGRNNGARGGKLVGAGAGGFLLFYAEDTRRLRARCARRASASSGSPSTTPAAPCWSGTEPAVQCVILAGGLGTRMWPVGPGGPQDPPPGGRTPVRRLAAGVAGCAGVTSVVYCIGFLGEQVRATSATGRGGASRSTYVDEGPSCVVPRARSGWPLDQGVLDDRFLVLYGDSWLQIDPAAVFRAQ